MGRVDELQLSVLDDLHEMERVLIDLLEHIGVIAHIRVVVLIVNIEFAIGLHVVQSTSLQLLPQVTRQLLIKLLDAAIAIDDNWNQNALDSVDLEHYGHWNALKNYEQQTFVVLHRPLIFPLQVKLGRSLFLILPLLNEHQCFEFTNLLILLESRHFPGWLEENIAIEVAVVTIIVNVPQLVCIWVIWVFKLNSIFYLLIFSIKGKHVLNNILDHMLSTEFQRPNADWSFAANEKGDRSAQMVLKGVEFVRWNEHEVILVVIFFIVHQRRECTLDLRASEVVRDGPSVLG